VKADLSALPMTLGARIEGLARWMGLAISADWQGLRHAAHAVALDQSALRVRTWNRRSDRQGGKVIPMIGLEGRLAITGQLAPILPLLALGAITHAGSHAAIGLGRYRLRIED
ncbi:MAG TPA: CRISPR system precrRNA processing endoribonuclease RAMP protein Cas6, partial [Magnetospirillum sp.]|nr:CRISPR system precrRNA processing endoribonuclease RAMP protein Cas6 [Magnetospirillum sp.]